MLSKNKWQTISTQPESHPEAGQLVCQLTEYYDFVISSISHEIRNALTLVNSSLQLVQTRHPEVGEDTRWETVMSDMKFLFILLADLSAFNKDARLATRQPVALSPIIRSICASFEGMLRGTEHRILFQTEGTIPLIQGDASKLRQVIINLITNAKDSLHSPGTILVKLTADAQFVHLDISDTGCGIPKEHYAQIWNPFRTFKKHGSGLGLPISRAIVCAHQGTIDFVSREGVGTTFMIKLPIG